MSVIDLKQPNHKVTPQLYEVESILQRGSAEGQRYYLVKWKGYSDAEATWQPESNLSGCKQAIDHFQRLIKLMEQEKSQNRNESTPKKAKQKNKDLQIIAKTHSPKKSKQNNQGEKPRFQKKIDSKICRKKNPIKQEINYFEELSQKNLVNNFETLKKTDDNCLLKQLQSYELEATTAQTIPTNREKQQQSYQKSQISSEIRNMKQQQLKRSQNKNFEVNFTQKTDEKTQEVASSKIFYQKGQQNPKLIATENNYNSKKQQNKLGSLKRQNNIYGNISHEIHQNICKKRRKLSISKDLFSLSLKNECHKINPNLNTHLKNTEPFNQSSSIISLKKQIKIKQQNKLTKEKNLGLFNKIQVENNYSHRFMLCEQEFNDLKVEFIESFYLIKQLSSQTPRCLMLSKFLDVSTPQCIEINNYVMSKLLNKNQVLMLDENGDFLYSKIEALIRNCEQNGGNLKKLWTCVIKQNSFNHLQSDTNKKDCYFVKVDDLREDSWKKLFRRFIISNSQ